MLKDVRKGWEKYLSTEEKFQKTVKIMMKIQKDARNITQRVN